MYAAMPRSLLNRASTVGSRTIERGEPQLRQAAAAARQELLKLAAARLGTTGQKTLTVTDGVVSVCGEPCEEGFLRRPGRR